MPESRGGLIWIGSTMDFLCKKDCIYLKIRINGISLGRIK